MIVELEQNSFLMIFEKSLGRFDKRFQIIVFSILILKTVEKKKKNMFIKGFHLGVFKLHFSFLDCLNTEFRKLPLTAFSF